jgi:hypothetical protein
MIQYRGAFQVNVTDDDSVGGVRLFVAPALSDAPIKLWVGDDAHTVLSALP